VPGCTAASEQTGASVLVVSVIEGGTSAIFTPAAAAALPEIVPDGQLERAWATTEARSYGAAPVVTALVPACANGWPRARSPAGDGPLAST
jgi:hypothetical protein